jgi:hypothetical protein
MDYLTEKKENSGNIDLHHHDVTNHEMTPSKNFEEEEEEDIILMIEED